MFLTVICLAQPLVPCLHLVLNMMMVDKEQSLPITDQEAPAPDQQSIMAVYLLSMHFAEETRSSFQQLKMYTKPALKGFIQDQNTD